MKSNTLRIFTVFIFVSLLIFFMNTSGFAEGKFKVNEGFYLGIAVPNHSIGGDFEGNSFLYSASEIDLIPKVQDGYGWGIILGGRFSKGAIELSYLRSTHDISFDGDIIGEATYHIINIDGKYYFLTDKPIQPFLLGGFCFPWLVAENSSFDGSNWGNTTFKGAIGLNLGGGIAAYLNPKVSVSLGLIYRWVSYSQNEGIDGIAADLEESLDGSGVNYNIALTFGF